MSEYAAHVVDSLSRAELDCNIPEYYEATFYQHIHRFRHTNLTYGNGTTNISESELLTIFDMDALPPDVNVTKKARIDNHRSVPTAIEAMQQAPSHVNNNNNVARPAVASHQQQAMNHMRPQHVPRQQYSSYPIHPHNHAQMYYNLQIPFAPQQQPAQYPSHNYTAQPSVVSALQGQGADLNLQLDCEDVIEIGPPQYPPSNGQYPVNTNYHHPY